MNKLIIVGNGFDLHNSLPSKYSDFLIWHVKKCIEAALNNDSFCDLLNIIRIDARPSKNVTEISSLDELVETFLNIENKYISNNGKPLYFNNQLFNLHVDKLSPFLNNLIIHHSSKKWVDIEMEYYKKLKESLKTKSIDTDGDIINLNKEMDTIKNSFIKYLKEIASKVIVDPNLDYSADWYIDARDIMELHHLKKLNEEDFENEDRKNIKAKEVCFLNFNYTRLTYKFKRRYYKHIDIHGCIDGGPNNQPVFGFGDEIDADYLEMEKTNNNNYFTHIKSFAYFKNSNYNDLVKFINSDSYVVYIWGHSCGLSDRTLLSMIFEHENCAAIKPYYWEKEKGITNYVEITHNISRHFKNKLKMRNRVVNFEFCSKLGSQH